MNDTDDCSRQYFCDLKSHKEVGHPFKIQFALFFPSSHMIISLVNILILLT